MVLPWGSDMEGIRDEGRGAARAAKQELRTWSSSKLWPSCPRGMGRTQILEHLTENTSEWETEAQGEKATYL